MESRTCVFRLKKCKVMMSKMKPLYLVFKNHDPQGSDIFLMYKKGDG
jgi:hypothetical protein